MAGSASAAANRKAAMGNFPALKTPFHHMSAIEADQVIAACQKIQTSPCRFFHNHVLAAQIGNLHAPRNDVFLFQYTIQQSDLHFADTVLQKDFQCLRFLLTGVYGRQAYQAIFPLTNFMTHIAQIATVRTVSIVDNQSAVAVIARSHSRVFLRQCIHGIGPVRACIGRVPRKSSVKICQEVIHVARYPGAVI